MNLIFVAIDDVKLIRKIYKKKFETYNLSPRSCVLGDTFIECHNSVQIILDLNADVCIFDQFLDYGEDNMLGTDIAHKLRKSNYNGLIILRSGSMADNVDPNIIDMTVTKDIKIDECFYKIFNLINTRGNLSETVQP